MGTVSSCIGGMNSYPSKEVHFNLMNSESYSQRMRNNQIQLKQRSNSQVFIPIKKDSDLILNQKEKEKIQNNFDLNKILQIENNCNNNSNNDNPLKKKLKGRSNVNIKKKMIESTEDCCDIIECEDDFGFKRSVSENIKSSDMINKKRLNFLPIQNLIINNIENIKPNTVKKENGGNIVDNIDKQLVINDYEDKGKKNLKYINNINLYKISKQNNISISDKNELNVSKINENNNNVQSYYEIVKNSNKKNKDYNNCKIDNNISFNINKSNIINNNNVKNNNKNINNFNNISSINSDFNNNNYIDISDNMTYFLSLEKSQHKPASTYLDKKNILPLNYNNNNSNIFNNNISLNDRNSVRVNKYKWKLLPKHKYNTQIYKSIMNLPNFPLSHENQTLLMNEEEKKNLNLTNITTIKNKAENSLIISQFKKQKEEQDKLIKSLEDKIKKLEKKIKFKGNMTKINEKKMDKINSINNKFEESQKDFRIKKLEEQLITVKKNNKLNKKLLKRKDEQIKTLMETKNKQDELIKKLEINKNLKPKNNNHNLTTKATIKEINYFDDFSKSNNYTKCTTSNSLSNLFELKMSFLNFDNSINIKSTKNNFKKPLNNKIKKFHKKENSMDIKKHFFMNNSANLEQYISLEPDIEHKNMNSSMRESAKFSNMINRSSSNVSYNNYCNDLCNKDKNNYNNKVTLNKKKIYKLNK